MNTGGLVMKKVIVTVDTEGHIGSDPVKRLICGLLMTAMNMELII